MPSPPSPPPAASRATRTALGASRLFFPGERDTFHTIRPSVRLTTGWGF